MNCDMCLSFFGKPHSRRKQPLYTYSKPPLSTISPFIDTFLHRKNFILHTTTCLSAILRSNDMANGKRPYENGKMTMLLYYVRKLHLSSVENSRQIKVLRECNIYDDATLAHSKPNFAEVTL